MNAKICIILFVLLAACNGNKKTDYIFNKIDNNKKEGLHLYYFQDGNIKAILNYRADSLNGESIYFYPNNRIKAKVHFVNNLENGMAYYFYPSGVIESYRQWENGKKVNYAQDYYDTLGYLKSYMYYNNEGALVWRNTVDVNGKVIHEEGKQNKL
ncbi:MAG: hypothetical protein U0V74_17240 [Chitinophagales bacterium]